MQSTTTFNDNTDDQLSAAPDQISLHQLEFPLVIAKLKSLLSTPYGEEKIDELRFSSDVQWVRDRLIEVNEMLALLHRSIYVPLGGYTDIRSHIARIQPEDAYLETEALLEIKGNLQLLSEVVRFFNEQREFVPSLIPYVHRIHQHRALVQEIDSKIDSSGEIYDNASHDLRAIRIKIRSLTSEQTNLLRKMQKRYAEYSQDDIVTLRDGRLVLGILPNAVSKVNGVVHGTSSSGATIFIEPMETLRISNEIQSLNIQERIEIIKILRRLTEMVRKVRFDILYALENIALLDLVLAKARLANALRANMPRLTSEPLLKLKNARHPLLILKTRHDNVVPLSLTLGNQFYTLVITGPNAGGKTVAMKTVGLLLLMTRMGMLIPADADSEIPLLSNVLVDIGDRQSLENDLSTFSAHVIRLKFILENAGANTLVLLDEAGTGTDPKEGAGLSVAILKELTEKKALTIATTHHGELKIFAHTEDDIENASMEFDLESLEPTYRLRIGIPGSSYAFEIARRYGLSEEIIRKSREAVGEEKDKLEELILELESQVQKYDKLSAELSISLSRGEAMHSLYERQVEEMKQNKLQLEKEAAAEARKILDEANALIERSVQEIRHNQADRKTIKAVHHSLRTEKEKVARTLRDGKTPSVEIEPLKKGDLVFVESLQQRGELLEDLPERGKVRVSIGHVKMTLNITGIRRSNAQSLAAPVRKRSSAKSIDSVSGGVSPELNLRGMDAETAIEETDRYLDAALESGWAEVRLVHGKGTGVLRKRINQYLARDKRISAKRMGKYGEGDSGVTVVTLRRE